MLDAREARRGGAARCRSATTRYDLDGLLAAIGPRTKLVYVCHPNNPTGTANGRDELLAFLERVPDHVLAVARPGVLRVHRRPRLPRRRSRATSSAGRRVAVLRTFSKIYGLAGLRVGYGVAPRGRRRPRRARCGARSTSPRPRRRPRSRASATTREIARRRALNATGRGAARGGAARARARARRSGGRQLPLRRRRRRARELFDRLLREGVIVRPLAGFGAPEAIRVTVGTPEENAFFAAALGQVLLGRLVTAAAARSPATLRCQPAAGASPHTPASGCSSSPPSARASGRGSPRSRSRSTSRTGRTPGSGSARVLVVDVPADGRRRAHCSARSLDRLAAARAHGRRRPRPRRGVRGAAVRDARRARSSRSRPSPGSRTGSSGPAVYAGIPNLVPEDELPERERAAAGDRELSWALGPIARRGAHRRRRPARGVLDQRGVVRLLRRARRADPGAPAAERDGALARALARPRDGFDAVSRSRAAARRAGRAGGSPRSAPARVNVAEIFLAKNTLHAGDFGYGLLYGAIGVGLVLGSLVEQPDARAARRRADVRGCRSR